MVLDGYVRVSKVGGRAGESFISPAVQRDKIVGWVARRGAELGVVFEELDVPGAEVKRPVLEQALARVEAHTSDGLVVARLDRFGRSLVEGVTAIERIQRAGGTFVSVGDGFDPSTDTGRLVMRLMLATAEWERDRYRENWEIARANAISRGVHLGRIAPTGYLHGSDGRLTIDPIAAPAVSEAFVRRARGERVSTISRMFSARGLRTVLGASRWTNTTVRGILSNRVYVGEVRSGVYVKAGAHEPLTDADTWERAQLVTERVERRHRDRPALLTGLLRCAGCRAALQARPDSSAAGESRVVYHCIDASAAGACPAPAGIIDSIIEPHVVGLALARARSYKGADHEALTAAERAYADARRACDAYRDDSRLELTLGPDGYAAGLAARVREVGRTRSSVEALTAQRVLPAGAETEPAWAAMSLDERRSALAGLIACAFVRRGHLRPSERIWVCWADEASGDLPRAGAPRPVIESFEPPGGWLGLANGDRRWSTARLERELRAALKGATVFPARGELEAAGKGGLLFQIERHGGAGVWARRLGLDHPPIRHSEHWTEPQIRSALEVYLGGSHMWPTQRQMAQEGLGGLVAAMRRTGGAQRWAAEFPLPRAPTDRTRPARGLRRAARPAPAAPRHGERLSPAPARSLKHPMSRRHRRPMTILIGEITSGRLAEGHLLPGEDDLAEQFDVGRGVARETVRALEERGLVRVTPGRGATVTPKREWHLLEPDVLSARLSTDRSPAVLADYLEYHRILEVEAAGLAARRATNAAMDRISDAYDALVVAAVHARANPAAEPLYQEADIALHRAIAIATGNRALARMTETIHHAVTTAFRSRGDLQDRLQRSPSEHERIRNAIADCDPDEARAAMADHIDTVAKQLGAGNVDRWPQGA